MVACEDAPMNRDSLVQLPAVLAPSRTGTSTVARFIMGIDGGANKTLAAVLDLERGELHLGHGGPSNQDAVGVHAATNALLEAADQAIERAGTSRDGLDAAVLAVAGTDTKGAQAQGRAQCPAGWVLTNDGVRP